MAASTPTRAPTPASTKNGEPLQLLPAPSTRPSTPSTPADEVLDAVAQLAQALERAATARLDLALYRMRSSAGAILLGSALGAFALCVAVSAWVFLTVGAALALAPVVGAGFAALIVGGAQLVVAGVLFFAAARQLTRKKTRATTTTATAPAREAS